MYFYKVHFLLMDCLNPFLTSGPFQRLGEHNAILKASGGDVSWLKRSISAFSQPSLFLFWSTTWAAAENTHSLSTLQRADWYFHASWARVGRGDLLLLQYSIGLSFLAINDSERYPHMSKYIKITKFWYVLVGFF